MRPRGRPPSRSRRGVQEGDEPVLGKGPGARGGVGAADGEDTADHEGKHGRRIPAAPVPVGAVGPVEPPEVEDGTAHEPVVGDEDAGVQRRRATGTGSRSSLTKRGSAGIAPGASSTRLSSAAGPEGLPEGTVAVIRRNPSFDGKDGTRCRPGGARGAMPDRLHRGLSRTTCGHGVGLRFCHSPRDAGRPAHHGPYDRTGRLLRIVPGRRGSGTTRRRRPTRAPARGGGRPTGNREAPPAGWCRRRSRASPPHGRRPGCPPGEGVRGAPGLRPRRCRRPRR